jgi:hypothetical protein
VVLVEDSLSLWSRSRDQVHLLGIREDMPRLYNAADLVVLTARTARPRHSRCSRGCLRSTPNESCTIANDSATSAPSTLRRTAGQQARGPAQDVAV